MRRNKNRSRLKNEQGVVITLVAVFMLGVIGAMAALSIDVVTLYTARSEAQLAADAAALAGARVLANSGMTSTFNASTTVGDNAAPLAMAVATQVAASSTVGGRTLNPGASPCVAGQEICVNIVTTGVDFVANPQVTVQVQRTDLPTFFARIWGTTQLKVAASATAEAYNPSSLQGTGGGPGLPIAPMCVKPWLLPNLDPSNPGKPIFFAASGALAPTTTNLLGYITPAAPGSTRFRTVCAAPSGNTDCSGPTPPPTVWKYYPGTTDATTGSFPAPSDTSCAGCAGFTPYQLSIAGCVQTPIACSSQVNVDITAYPTRDTETATAVNTLTHATAAANSGDSVDTAEPIPPGGNYPFQFLAGSENPVVLSGAMAAQTQVAVSDSLVTVPVIDTTTAWPPTSTTYPTVQIIGFVQLFLNPTGTQAPADGHIHTQVINIVGCGTPGAGGVAGQAILGNGASAVAVRLIHP